MARCVTCGEDMMLLFKAKVALEAVKGEKTWPNCPVNLESMRTRFASGETASGRTSPSFLGSPEEGGSRSGRASVGTLSTDWPAEGGVGLV